MAVTKAAPAKTTTATTATAGRYTFAVGRRKTATASVKLFPKGS